MPNNLHGIYILVQQADNKRNNKTDSQQCLY